MRESCDLGLSGVSQTLLVPLAARALARRLFPAAGFADVAAERAMETLGIEPTSVISDPLSILGFIIRSRLLDRLTKRFLAEHENAVVLDLGAGFSTAFERCGASDATWIEVDLPAVTELHRRVVPADARRRRIAASLETTDWLVALELPDAPTLVIAEGVLPYLSRPAIVSLFRALADRLCGRTSVLLYDTFSFLMVGTARYHPAIGRLTRKDPTIEFRSGVRTRADFIWGEPRWHLDEIHDVLAQQPPPVALWSGIVDATFGVPLYCVVQLHLDAPAPGE
ncbi:class I SAM-dependent methyltransferase [Amorphus sp. 3PC139-8]|uniref:class I SAM-dependent methyltransferase n=1 Tax=Amorphus sp. 3PC139-8 TaxID=2735676 RepID=UPI00345C8716